MKKYDSAFSSAASKVGTAAKKTVEEYVEKGLPDEPSVSVALVTRIKDAISGFSKGGITWSAKILSSHGPGTEEAKIGADIVGALSLKFPEYSVKKGFLAQAKRQEPGKALDTKEWKRLQDQCKLMLACSPESFVFVYAMNGFYVVPAISVSACSGREDLHTLHPKTLSAFYKEHFMCFVGDKSITEATTSVLDNLLVRVAYELSASAVDERDLFTEAPRKDA